MEINTNLFETTNSGNIGIISSGENSSKAASYKGRSIENKTNDLASIRVKQILSDVAALPWLLAEAANESTPSVKKVIAGAAEATGEMVKGAAAKTAEIIGEMMPGVKNNVGEFAAKAIGAVSKAKSSTVEGMSNVARAATLGAEIAAITVVVAVPIALTAKIVASVAGTVSSIALTSFVVLAPVAVLANVSVR